MLIYKVIIASSPYGKMDVYYNDKIITRKEIAKPTLKIEEPFKIKINLTVYQKSKYLVIFSKLGVEILKLLKGLLK